MKNIFKFIKNNVFVIAMLDTLEYLKKGGKIVVNTQQIDPMPVIIGAATYPDEIVEKIKALGVDIIAEDAKVYVIDDAELERVQREYPVIWKNPNAAPKLCFVGCPHLSLEQLKDWTDKIEAELKKNGTKKVVIPTSVNNISDNIFSQLNDIMILCELTARPSTWNSNWHGSNESRVYWDATDYIEEDLYSYIVNNNNEASIVKISTNDTIVNIPEKIGEYTVTAVGNNLFRESNVVEVTLPDTITKISDYAFYNCDSLVTVIGKNVAEIGNYAFYSCNQLITIDCDDVLYARDYAFYDCYNLTDVTWLNGLIEIGSHTFHNCQKFATSIIFDKLEKVGSEAFDSNYTLKTVFFPETAKTLNSYVFEQCNGLNVFTAFSFQPDGWSSNWNNTNANVTWGVKAFLEDDIFEYVVQSDDTVKAIKLKDTISETIVIPETIGSYTITQLGANLFDGMSMAQNVLVPDTITDIDINTFARFLMRVYLECAKEQEGFESGWESNYNITSIWNVSEIKENDDFEYVVRNDGTIILTKLLSNSSFITIPETIDDIEVVAINKQFINNNQTVKEIFVKENITEIQYSAFYDGMLMDRIAVYCEVAEKPDGWSEGWDDQTTVVFDVLEISQTSIYKYIATSNGVHIAGILDNDLTRVTIPDTINDLPVISIQDGLFKENNLIMEVTLPDTVLSIGNNVFNNCSNLAVVNAKGVKNIGDYAFYYCQNLRMLNVDSVEYIGDHSFYNCSSLINVDWIDDVKVIGNYAFYYNNNSKFAKEIVLSQVESIGNYAFYDCNSIKVIYIPNTCSMINDHAFYSCDNLTIYTNYQEAPADWNYNWNPSNRTVNYGYVISKNDEFIYQISNEGTIKILGVNNIEVTDIVIPTTIDGYQVTELADYLFYNNNYILTVTLPDAITRIEDYTFSNCQNLKSVTGNGIEYLGNNAFENCYKLSNCDWINNLKVIMRQALYNCYNISSDIKFSQLERIGYYGLYNCDQLNSVFINKNAILDNYAIYECSNITIYCEEDEQPLLWDSNWNPNNKPVYWGCADIFENDNYKGMIKNDNTLHISSSQNINDEILIIDEIDGYNVSSIGPNAFYNNDYIKTLFIKDSVKIIDDYAFQDCSNLRYVYLGSNVEFIGYGAFQSCNIYKINLPTSIKTIEYYAFSSSYSLQFYIEGSYYGDYWEYNWNVNTNRYDHFNSSRWLIDEENSYVYSLDDSGNKTLVFYYGTENVGTMYIPSDIYKIEKYAIGFRNDINKVVIPLTVYEVEEYGFYELNNIMICIAYSNHPNNWNNICGNCSCSYYYSYDVLLERGEVKVKSTSYEKDYDGVMVWTNEISELIAEGLQEGDYVNGDIYNNGYTSIGEYRIDFWYEIYNQNGENVTQYYDIVIEYGTLTIK